MNIKGTKGRGGYSYIVYLDGDLYAAEDEVGATLKEDANAGTVAQAAINALPAQGGKIQFGYGYFGLTTPLQMKSYVALHGLGSRSTILTGKADMNSVISFPSGTQHGYATLKDMTIDHDFTYTVPYVIDAYNLEYSTFDNLYVMGKGFGIYLHMQESGKTAYVNQLINVMFGMDNAANQALIVASTDNKILSCTIFEGKGVKVSTGANYNLISNTHIAGSSEVALYSELNTGLRVLGCEIENNSGIGIWLYRTTVASTWATIANNSLYLNTTRDIHMDNIKAASIVGNTCASSLPTSISTINNSDYNVIVGNITEGTVSIVGANNEVAHNILV